MVNKFKKLPPVLYASNEDTFNHMGEGILNDAIRCEVREEHNGDFLLELIYPIQGRLFNKIKGRSIIKAWAGPELEYQLFRVVKIDKEIKGTIKYKAIHITYDIKKNFIKNINLKNVLCDTAIKGLLAACERPHKFTGSSDLTNIADFHHERVNPLDIIKGTRGSLIDTFGNGSHVIRDNFKISVNRSRGKDSGILVSYGGNMLGFTSEDEYEDIITAIYPYAILQDEELNETVITLPEEFIYSPYKELYDEIMILPVQFDAETEESLRTQSSNFFNKTRCDIPNANYKLSMIPLSQTENYKNRFKVIENVAMNDLVLVRDYRFKINVEARVIATKYDALNFKLISCEVGNFKRNIKDTVSDISQGTSDRLKEIESNVGKGFEKVLEKAIQEATDLINAGAKDSHVVVKQNEILIMDDPDVNKAIKVWRWNKNGFGYSDSGYTGDFDTAITMDGKILAKFITAITITANEVKGGVLSSLDGSLQIDLASTGGGLATLFNGTKAVEIKDTNVWLYDWEGKKRIGRLSTTRAKNGVFFISLTHLEDGATHVSYYNPTTNKDMPYIEFDKYNKEGNSDKPIAVYEEIEFNKIAHFLENLKMMGANMPSGGTGPFLSTQRTMQIGLHNETNNVTAPNISFEPSENRDSRVTTVWGSFNVNGTKNCVHETKNFGNRALHAYETAEIFFGDIGESIINSNGEVTIIIDEVFRECINTEQNYHVFTQRYNGEIYSIARHKDKFKVYGSPGTHFSWELKGKRLGYEDHRLTEYKDKY